MNRDTLPFPATHEVTIQPPPLENVNLFAVNAALQEALARGAAEPGRAV